MKYLAQLSKKVHCERKVRGLNLVIDDEGRNVIYSKQQGTLSRYVVKMKRNIKVLHQLSLVIKCYYIGKGLLKPMQARGKFIVWGDFASWGKLCQSLE